MQPPPNEPLFARLGVGLHLQTRSVRRLGIAFFVVFLLGCGESRQPEVDSSSTMPPQTAAPQEAAVKADPVASLSPEPLSAFAPSGACASCHVEQHAAFRGSHHDLAIQPATPATVRGNFDGASFTQFGVTTTFRRDGERFVVETEGEDGERGVFAVAYTFGVEPLQQVLIEFGGGKLQSLTIAWDTEREVWFSLYPDEHIAPGDPLHWTGRLQRWNTMCAECHSTALDRGYRVADDTYQPTWAELSVGCQACHGPGAAHVAWAAEDGRNEGEAEFFLTTTLRKPALGPASRDAANDEVEICAPCHSLRRVVSGRAVIGEPFLDHYQPDLLRPPLYHVDGQVREEVYVTGSFTQSRMHERGVRCSDCHDPHSLALRAEGNAVCTQCHSEQGNARFPTLALRTYDSPAHHFHATGSDASSCLSCHMPAATFMQVDERHDHSLRVPRPDLSERFGVPNACNGCHADRDPEWAAAEILKRSGAPPRRHHGEILAAGWTDPRSAASDLETLALDPTSPAIARATAVELLSTVPGTPASTSPALLEAVRDPAAIVRASAIRALETQPSAEGLAAVLAALEDERRAVRIEAARVLGGMPEERLSPKDRTLRAKALEEYRASQLAVADTPGAHLNLGVLHQRRQHTSLAIEAYEQAISLAPEFVPARVNLANLYNATGRNDEAERELRAALATVERWPAADGSTLERGEIHYSLGLLLAEGGRLEEAEGQLGTAVADLPRRVRVRYNYALSLQELGRADDAERQFLEAERIAPDDPDVQSALAILHFQAGRADLALPYATRASSLRATPEARQLLETVRRALAEAAAP